MAHTRQRRLVRGTNGRFCGRDSESTRNLHDTNLYGKFFKAIAFGEERKERDSKTEVIGNDCLLGQIATFCESLHLSYREVFEEIPYRNLVIMSKDKLHVCFGTKVNRISGKEMAKSRGKKIIKKKDD